jgi:polyribonucleotide nucleotidyltransferase
MHILGELLKTMDAPRTELKPYAPRIEILMVAKDCIGGIIGPGGKIIQKLQLDTDTTITIEEIDGMGKVEILGTNKDGMDAAIAKIKEIAFTPTVGEEYDGRVKNIQAYGAFVEIAPGKDGLLHISEIDHKRINNVEDVLKVDDAVKVRIIDVDQKTGKMKFSRKVLLPKPETKPAE